VIQRKTVIVRGTEHEVRTHLAPFLRSPLIGVTGRLVSIQDPIIDELGNEAIDAIAKAYSVPLVAIRMLDELPTQARDNVLALPERTG